MIFLTVGTTKFPFNRLLETVDGAIRDLGIKEDLVAQIGKSDYGFQYKNTEVYEEIAFDKMISYLKRARIIVTPAGPATILLALEYGRYKPLIVPRLKEFGEHVGDHQLFFARALKKENIGKVFLGESGLQEVIKGYFLKPEKKKITKKDDLSKNNLVRRLIDFTEKLDGKK